jgi:hypothetical protein
MMGEAEELTVREEQLVIDWEVEVGVGVLKREEAFVKLLAAAVEEVWEQRVIENSRRRFWQPALLLRQQQPELHLEDWVLSQKEEGARVQVVSEQNLKVELAP